MVHLNLDAESYSILKSIAREEERSLRTVAARAIRRYCETREPETQEQHRKAEEVLRGA